MVSYTTTLFQKMQQLPKVLLHRTRCVSFRSCETCSEEASEELGTLPLALPCVWLPWHRQDGNEDPGRNLWLSGQPHDPNSDMKAVPAMALKPPAWAVTWFGNNSNNGCLLTICMMMNDDVILLPLDVSPQSRDFPQSCHYPVPITTGGHDMQ